MFELFTLRFLNFKFFNFMFFETSLSESLELLDTEIIDSSEDSPDELEVVSFNIIDFLVLKEGVSFVLLSLYK